MIIRIGERKGQYGPDVSWIGEEGQAIRDEYAGCYILPLSYPGAPTAELRKHDSRPPDVKFFSPERFVQSAEKAGWEFHGTRYHGRKPMTKWKKGEFGKEIEKPIMLIYHYFLKGEDDIPHIVLNAQKKVQAFEPQVSIFSPRHGMYLSQEMYEAGWFWIFKGTPDDIKILKGIYDRRFLP